MTQREGGSYIAGDSYYESSSIGKKNVQGLQDSQARKEVVCNMQEKS